MAEQGAVRDVGALAEACVSRVGCYGTSGVPVHELWEHSSAMAGCSTGLLDPRQGSMETTAVLELPPLATDIDHEMVAVAAKELTAESLGLHDPNITLNDIQQRLLQEVAQAGENGAMQSDLTKKFSIDARTIHYNVRHLQGYGLVKVQKGLKSNIICLTRHYNACLRKLEGMGPTGSAVNVGSSKAALNSVAMAERVLAALHAARDCTLLESEVRNTVGMKGNPHKTAWAHVKRELARRGAVSIRVTVNGRVQSCLHLKLASECETIGSETRPAAGMGSENVEQGAMSGLRVRAEESLQQQIYNVVIESGEEVAANRLCVVAETIKSQVNYRLIGPEYFRAEKFISVSTSPSSAAESRSVHGKGVADQSKFPRTVQQQRRREKVQDYVNKHRMVWLQDVLQWMRSDGGDDVDKKVLIRLVSQLQNEGKIQTLYFSTRTSLRHQERQTQAIFATGVPRDGPEVQAFVGAKAVKRRKFSDTISSRQQAAQVRIRRLTFGFIEGRMARAKALHLYLWSCDTKTNQQFSMESVLEDMKLRDYAQLLGITTADLPGIDDLLAQNVKVSALPEPHCHTFINGQPTFYSFKSMLGVLIKLGLVSPAVTSNRSEPGQKGTRKDAPANDPVGVSGDLPAIFSHFSLTSTVRLPGHANQATVDAASSSGSASSHLALCTVAQFGITSDTTRDRAYFLNRDGELDEYWSDLHSFVTERSRAVSTQARDTDPSHARSTNPESVAQEEGISELPELFRMRSWVVEKPLNAMQRVEVERAIHAADVQPPYVFKLILQIAKSTKIPLVSLVAHFNNPDEPVQAVVTSRLMPIRHRADASSRSGNVSAAVSGGPRKYRKRQSAARNRNPEPAVAVATGGMAHEPDHVAAYIASAQAGRRKNAASNADRAERKEEADNCATEKVSDDDDSDRVVPRRAAKLQWNSQMDMDLAVAYISERNRVARSDKCYRVSWANIGVEMNVPPDRARRRWSVLQKEPKFKQATTMASNGSSSQSSLLQLILQGGTEQPSLLDTPLPATMDALHRSFFVRDGSLDVRWAGRMNPKISALTLVLKAILLVPEDHCERDIAITLLTRFENSDIEHAIKIMKAQQLLTSVKGAKANSRAFRLSAKFHDSRKLVAANYQRDIFDSIRVASADIRSKFEHTAAPAAPAAAAAAAADDDDDDDDDGEDFVLGDVDPVTGGGHAAVVLSQVVEGTLILTPKSLGAEDETTHGADQDTTSSTAPHASILSHLLLVGGVQHSAESRSSSGVEGAKSCVHLPPWQIGIRRSVATYLTAAVCSHAMNTGSLDCRHESMIDWSRIGLVGGARKHAVDLPVIISEAASEIGIPYEIVYRFFSEIHRSGRQGATMEDIMQLIQPVDLASRATTTVSLSAASQEVVDFLAKHQCIVRVSAWDHHRYVSSIVDHVWSVPRQSGQHLPSDHNDAAAESAFPYASALTSWTRIDSGVDEPFLRSLRQAIAALIMKHPGIEEGTVCARVESIHPREVQDLLQCMVDEGLLRAVDQRVLARRASLFHPPTWETVRCYWARPKIHDGSL